MRGNTRMTAHIQRSLEKEAEGEDTGERAEKRAQCWRKTKEEIASGLVSVPRSKGQLDRKYGRGKWRPLRRSAIKQKGKWRCIDNAKASKHNKATTMHERLTCGRADLCGPYCLYLSWAAGRSPRRTPSLLCPAPNFRRARTRTYAGCGGRPPQPPCRRIFPA